MNTSTIKALAEFVAKHAEEFAACFGGAAVGAGVKDEAPAPATALPPGADLMVPGAEVSIEIRLPQYATPVSFRGTVEQNVPDQDFCISVSRRDNSGGAVLMRWSCTSKCWTSPQYYPAYGISVEVVKAATAAKETKR